MHRKLIVRGVLTSMAMLASPVILAGFATYSKDWPDDACIVNEKVTAVKKKSACTPSDASAVVIETEEPDKRLGEYRRLYGKIGATFLTAQIRNITNTSTPVLSAGNVVQTTANENYMSWQVGLGTKFQYVRMEVEYLYEKNVPYNVNPLFFNTTSSESITSKLMSQSVWFDLLYDMEKLNLPYFTPYFGGLFGVVWNKTRTALTGTVGNGIAQNHSRIAFGWGVTVGARMPFWNRWFGYLGYKYLDHGKTVWVDSTGLMSLKGHYVVQGIEVGVQYLLG